MLSGTLKEYASPKHASNENVTAMRHRETVWLDGAYHKNVRGSKDEVAPSSQTPSQPIIGLRRFNIQSSSFMGTKGGSNVSSS